MIPPRIGVGVANKLVKTSAPVRRTATMQRGSPRLQSPLGAKWVCETQVGILLRNQSATVFGFSRMEEPILKTGSLPR